MPANSLKSHLSDLIQKESDMQLLELVRTLLEDKEPAAAERRMILEGILRSEEDVASGKVHDPDSAKGLAKEALKPKGR
jgi:hypothetical protein